MIEMLRRVLVSVFQSILVRLPPRAALLLEYVVRCRRLPRIQSPQTFTEKVLWRKLYDARVELSIGCNKLRAKEWAADRLAGDGIKFAETIWSGRYEDVPDAVRIRLDSTIRSWVLKPATLGGGIVMFGSGNAMSEGEYQEFVKRFEAGRRLFSRIGGKAWGDGQFLAMIEERIGESGSSLVDYKVHVFNGRAVYIVTYSDRFDATISRRYDLRSDVASLIRDFGIPEDVVGRLVRAAEHLAAGLDYMRVDFYVVGSEVYFGELTPYPSFAEADVSRSFDRSLGELWKMEGR